MLNDPGLGYRAERLRASQCDPPGWAMLAAIPCNCTVVIGSFKWPL